MTVSSPAFALPAQLTPGAYMRQCRRRSGKSLRDCAAAIALQQHDRDFARRDLAALERDCPGDYGRLARLLRDRAVFPFDMGTFVQLAAATAAPELDPWAEI
jgi:hypothetical protein